MIVIWYNALAEIGISYCKRAFNLLALLIYFTNSPCRRNTVMRETCPKMC